MNHNEIPIVRPNIMIVSGNGRNTGKTSFVCRVIASVSETHQITAIKISPHFHPDDSEDIISRNEHFIIKKEKDAEGSKDSSRMLLAGASKVYYLEVFDKYLKEAFEKLNRIADLSGAVICESGGLRHIIDPGLFIMLNRPDLMETKDGFNKLRPLANKIVLFDGNEFDFQPENIYFDKHRWEIK